ncbi:ABC transporter ATP-binding protein [Candidatus Poribacteria bacterium]|nr:ABC transporter ATP-binding protein [Candidatus Poribacteria bacterium]
MLSQFSIEANELTRRFGSFVAVDRLSLKVTQGEVFGFLGPNGAGKSTTIRMLCGILAPSDGDALVAGHSVRRDPERVKRSIGYMSQRFSLYEDLTASENIDFYGGIHGIGGRELRARKGRVLEMSGLAERADELASVLSGGWRQRLALGCAMLHDPPILFLDEPTSGVDPISRRNFWDLIYTVAQQGTTVLVTTHYMDEAEHCDHLGLVHAGKMIAYGSPDELKDAESARVLVEIECSPVMNGLTALRSSAAVRDVALFGAALHATLADESSAEAVRQELERARVQVSSISRIRPSLEDVFVSLVESGSTVIGAP